MEYAGFWRRGAAIIIDTFLFMIVQVLLSVVLIGGVVATGSSEEAAGVVVFLINLAMIVVMWLYFALMESSKIQGTLGKMMVGIVVTDLDGNRIGFGKASGRYFGKIVSSIILMIGYVMAAFTERRQALHDIMAGCLVIRKPRSSG